jgi:hypothetical protein
MDHESTCDECGEVKPDVEYVADPFDEEIYREINMRHICLYCQKKIYDET